MAEPKVLKWVGWRRPSELNTVLWRMKHDDGCAVHEVETGERLVYSTPAEPDGFEEPEVVK